MTPVSKTPGRVVHGMPSLLKNVIDDPCGSVTGFVSGGGPKLLNGRGVVIGTGRKANPPGTITIDALAGITSEGFMDTSVVRSHPSVSVRRSAANIRRQVIGIPPSSAGPMCKRVATTER